MQKVKNNKQQKSPQGPSLFGLLGSYKLMIFGLVLLAVAGNVLTLWLPKIISNAIDSYAKHGITITTIVVVFGAVSFGIFILLYLQNIMQTFASEKVARDLRNQLAAKISMQSYGYVQSSDPSKLLAYLTSDMDAVKLFVAQAIVSIISSIVIIIGASALLISIDWRLALGVLSILPLIVLTFFFTLRRVRMLFLRSRGVIDRLNRVINESILGAAIVRVINAGSYEKRKFETENATSRDIGFKIVRIFAILIPAITFFAGFASLIILLLGGRFVIDQTLSLGNFAAFSSYVAILIFPILVLGFISNIIAQANASYSRIGQVLSVPDVVESGIISSAIDGHIEFQDVALSISGKQILKNVTFDIAAKSRTAIIGPTAAGKSQLLYTLAGLVAPDNGDILVDKKHLRDYAKKALYDQMGFVFQDSIIFNLSLRENIAFSPTASDESLQLAIATAELGDLIDSLPDGLDTIISERGTSLSGGQKQRLMLARALAIGPKILLLDDFTARVDTATEKKILANVRRNYPQLTLISVTQKIAPVEKYDQVILLMEGEVLAMGTHTHLLATSPEYMQIFNSQRSTTQYEL
jgi:ATP-binding cassette subfamily B protein